MNDRIKSCYISAPPGANLKVLREALSRRNVRVVVPDELSVSGGLADQVEQLLSGVDLMVAVITSHRRSAWVYFELGMAKAKGIQTVVFTPPTANFIPPDLAGLLYIRTNLSNAEAINFAFDQILAAPEPRPQSETKHFEPPRVLGRAADTYLDRLSECVADGDGLGLERLVAQALREAGVDALSESPRPDRGVDLAVWSDSLQSHVGNPLLVEIKSKVAGFNDLQRATSQLSKALEKSGTRWGLLLYGKGPPADHLRSNATPNVLLISLRELFERMRTEPFPEIVKNLRNQRVHGRRP